MSKITLTALDLAKIARSLFTNQPALYITDGTGKLNRKAYSEHRAFFDASPERRIGIFQTHWEEYDSCEDFNDFAQMPTSYAKVEQLAPGIYECSLRYFGRKYAHAISTARTDADITQILLRMQRDGGLDHVEIDRFIAQVRGNSEKKLAELAAEEFAEDAASTNGKESVN